MSNRSVLVFFGMGLMVGALAQPSLAGIYEKGGANGVGARAMGLAGAYSALAEDETGAWWNPAGLGDMETVHLGSSLGSQYDGRMRSYNFSAAAPFIDGVAGAFSWQHDLYTQSADINADTLLIAGCLPLSEDRRLYLGTGLKILFGGIQHSEATFFGLGMDLGLRYKLSWSQDQSLVLGLRLQDVDTRLQWRDGGQEQVPLSMAFGGAWHMLPRTLMLMELETIQSGQDSNQGSSILRLGAEHRLQEPLSLRAGWILDSRRASTFTLGAGYKYSEWELEYAFLGMVANLGVSHRLTLTYGIPPIAPVVATKPLVAPTIAPTPSLTPVPTREYGVELTALPDIFSPNGDGVADTVIFHGALKEGDLTAVATWHLSLENQEGTVVRDLSGKEFVSQIEWDGTNEGGQMCGDGSYLAKWLLQDNQGQRLGYAEIPVTLRTRLPRFGIQVTPSHLTLINGFPEESLRFSMKKNDGLRENGWQMVIRAENNAVVKTFQKSGPVPETIVWDGKTADQHMIQPGKYQVVLTITDSIGLQLSSMQTFEVVNVDAKVNLDIAPRLLQPGDRQNGHAVFRMSVTPQDQVTAWKLEIRMAQGNKLVRAFGRAGVLPESLTWDAKDRHGFWVKGGTYFLAKLMVHFHGQASVESLPQALATDIDNSRGGRALALHLTTVVFPTESNTIPLEAYKFIRQAAETIKKYAKHYHVQVKGYTDSRESAGKQFELSWERAMKVRDYLHTACGLPENNLEVAGYGSDLPLAPETSSAGRSKNRRVEIVLIIER